MTNVDITLFMNMKDIKNSGATWIDLNDSQAATDFNTMVDGLHNKNGMPRFMAFASYQDKHNQASLNSNGAIVLEYAFKQRGALEGRISSLGWNALVFNSDRRTGATVTAVFPLVNPITDEKAYTRSATVVAHWIGLYDLLDGKSNTFLVQPAANARAVLLNHMADPLGSYVLSQSDWLEFANYQQAGPAPKVKTISAAEFVSQLPKAQPHKPTKAEARAMAHRALDMFFDAEGF